MSVTVRAIDVVDQALVDALNRLIPQLSADATPLDLTTLNEITQRSGNTVFVAEHDGAIVGTLTLVVVVTPTGSRAWIEDVVVDQSARGMGVGRALVATAVGVARDQGVRKVDLTSKPSRVEANGLYQSLGFVARETNVYRMS